VCVCVCVFVCVCVHIYKYTQGDTGKTATGMREAFGRMGFSDREMVCH
jgi:hypothetical protein